MVFYQVFLLSPLQWTVTNCRNCKRLREFEEIEIWISSKNSASVLNQRNKCNIWSCRQSDSSLLFLTMQGILTILEKKKLFLSDTNHRAVTSVMCNLYLTVFCLSAPSPVQKGYIYSNSYSAGCSLSDQVMRTRQIFRVRSSNEYYGSVSGSYSLLNGNRTIVKFTEWQRGGGWTL